MKYIFVLALLTTTRLFAQHGEEGDLTSAIPSTPMATLYFKNTDTVTTVKVKLRGGAKCTLAPGALSKSIDMLSIPETGGYKLWSVSGKQETVLAEEDIPEGTAYVSGVGTWMGIIARDSSNWYLRIRRYDPKVDGKLPR